MPTPDMVPSGWVAAASIELCVCGVLIGRCIVPPHRWESAGQRLELPTPDKVPSGGVRALAVPSCSLRFAVGQGRISSYSGEFKELTGLEV